MSDLQTGYIQRLSGNAQEADLMPLPNVLQIHAIITVCQNPGSGQIGHWFGEGRFPFYVFEHSQYIYFVP